MLKKRVVATLVVQNGIVVQSINFKKYLPIGKPSIAMEYLNQWGVDEIVLIDISATRNIKDPNYSMIKRASEKCFVPLTVGGGISNLEHIEKLMHCGADKISLNTAAIHNPELISSAAKIFGDQCVVISIDAISTAKGYRVYDYLNNNILDTSPAIFAKKVVELGAGEILINSVDRDGSYLGFDIELINSVCELVNVPVICSGGAKNADDFVQVFQNTSVSAASAANLFNFFEHSVNITKSGIKRKMDVRLETYADYNENSFDENYRLVKKSDDELKEMLFVRIEKEVI